MKFPVFARRSNPAVDRPILRKSKSYVEEQVGRGVAEWVDETNPKRGIICCEMLASGKVLETVSAENTDWQWKANGELRGVKVVPPSTSPEPSMAAIRARWDWSTEQVPLYA